MALWSDSLVRHHLVKIGATERERSAHNSEEIVQLRLVTDQLATMVFQYLAKDAHSILGKGTLLQYMKRAAEPQPADMIDTGIVEGFWSAMTGGAA